MTLLLLVEEIGPLCCRSAVTDVKTNLLSEFYSQIPELGAWAFFKAAEEEGGKITF